MFNLIWPIALIVFSNTVYQVCAKSVPSGLDTFASLTITYLVAAVACAVMFFVMNRGGSLTQEYARLNWASFILGIAVVGLEVGCIFAYKNGWPVNSMQVVQGTILAIVLIGVGYVLFKEPLTRDKLIGMVICLIGLYFINK